jgi:cell division protein FtsB
LLFFLFSILFLFATRKSKYSHAQINRDPKLAKIAELTEENARLKKRIVALEKEMKELAAINRKPSARQKATSTRITPEMSTVPMKKACCVIS